MAIFVFKSMYKKKWKVFCVLFVMLLVSYAFVLDNDFLGDDIIRIIFNSELDSLYHSLTGKLGDRPLLMLLMWAEKTLFGLNPIYYKIVNLFIHALTGYQFFLLLLEMNNGSSQGRFKIASIVSLLFVLHPLHNQSINIVIQIGVVLAGLFGIYSIRSFHKWLNGEGAIHAFKSVLSLVIALLFKPIVTFLPFYYFFAVFILENVEKKKRQVLPAFFLPLLIPLASYLIFDKNIQDESVSPIKYFLTQTEVLFIYFKLIIFPVGLKYLYDFFPPKNLIINVNWLYFLSHVFLIVLGSKIIKKKILYLYFIGFYLSFVPESSFFPINHLAFEHRTFYSILFLFLFAGSKAIELNLYNHRGFKIVSMFMVCSYIILNQARNFQIKPFRNWILHTVENSYVHHDYNFSFSLILLRTEEPGKLKEIFRLYDRRYSNDPGYQILISIYNSALYKERKTEFLQKAIQGLGSEKISDIQRKYINIHLISELEKDGAEIVMLKMLERSLSAQLSFFFKKSDFFDQIIEFYQVFTTKLLLFKDNNGQSILSKEDKLRVSNNLCKYYKMNCVVSFE